MIKNIKCYPGLWGFGIISVLWILGIIFSGQILFIDTIEFGWGSETLSSIFPFAFLIILTLIACISKRNCMKTFFVSSYVFAAIPIVSTLPWFFYGVFEDNAILSAIFLAFAAFSQYLGMPVVSVTNAVAYSDVLAFIILLLSLLTSMVCYFTVKEKDLSRPGIWC